MCESPGRYPPQTNIIRLSILIFAKYLRSTLNPVNEVFLGDIGHTGDIISKCEFNVSPPRVKIFGIIGMEQHAKMPILGHGVLLDLSFYRKSITFFLENNREY